MSVTGQPQASPDTLELYKLAVEMADRVSARRGSANAYFLTIQAALGTVLGVVAPKEQELPESGVIVLVVIGCLISAAWWLQLRSYRDLNRAKFQVIHRIETQLPHRIFADEWDCLKSDPIPKWRGRYAELGLSERSIPLIFGLLYGLLLLNRWVS